ncbi:MAG TPA: MarC family protein [Nitrospiria bacterium]|jgi:multiple antibiotic resistance protein|nr:MarC family protein [Nitrospiria bacterium]
MKVFLHHFGHVFAALFPVINPPGMALLFIAMTRRAGRAQRIILAGRIAFYAFIIINVSYYVGTFLLDFFDISLPVLRVAGGIVLASSGWRLLNETRSASETGMEIGGGSGDWAQMAFYPLTMPITTGPGTISVTIAMGAILPRTIPVMLGALAASMTVSAAIYLCYRYADRIEGRLGKTGSEALSRLFAFILVCIGVQILWNGISELWGSLPPQLPAGP